MASKKKVVSLSVVTAIVLVLVIALSIVANSFLRVSGYVAGPWFPRP